MRGSRRPSGSMARFSIPQCCGSAGGASRQPPHKPKSRSGFCPLRLFLYTIRAHPAGCRRNRRSGVSLLHRCLFACYTFQFVYLCIYYPFCISFIGYLPLFGIKTDLFSQKNPAFLSYKRLPLRHFHLPALTSAQLHTTPLSVCCRFHPAFQARSVLFCLKYTNRKAKCRQLPIFSLKESWFIPSLLYLSLQVFVYVSFYF